MYYLHIFCYEFCFGQNLGKHYCLGYKSEEKICFGLTILLQTCIVILHMHHCSVFFPARSRKLLGLGAFGVHLIPLKWRLLLVCAIWAHKPLARWLHYHLLNSWILWVLRLPECHIPGCSAIVGLWRWKGACGLYQLLDKSTSTSPCYPIRVKFFSARILNYNDWKHFATDICWASQHTSLHNISFLYTSRFASVLFFLVKQFWCLKMLALNSLLAGFLQRSSWKNCLPFC